MGRTFAQRGPSTRPIRSIRTTPSAAIALAALGAIATDARGDIPLKATRVASGLTEPLYVTAPPGDDSRLFIVEQHSGQIKILNLTGPNAGQINTAPFLDIDGLATGGEQGLLGLAFHPDYANNGQFYVNLNISGSGATHIRRYTRSATNPNIATPTSAQTVLTYAQPQSNHNGGWVGFGPFDGYLYIASGDGGAGNDQGSGHTEPNGNAQDTTNNHLGKMLRLDVNGDDFSTDPNRNYRIPRGGAGQPPANPFTGEGDNRDDEIWAYGLRNPFRASHDRLTGDMYIGDVGQGAREEIDFQPGDSRGGENYGWRFREGFIQTPGSVGGPKPADNVDPIHDYPRSVGATITGGYAYRGGENDALEGHYFFGDFGNGKIWSLVYDGTRVTKFREHTGQIPTDVGSIGNPSSFGEDSEGRLYVVDYGGEVFRLIPAYPGDANLDDSVTTADVGILAGNYGRLNGADWRMGDFNDDGAVTIADVGILATFYNTSRAAGLIDGPSFEAALAQYAAPDGIALPEPSLVGTAVVVALVSIARRRRRH